MRHAHGRKQKFLRHLVFAGGDALLGSPCTTKGGSAVDPALKLNVLAVCAAFVFIGAILLGAF